MQFINEMKQGAAKLLTENTTTLLTAGGVVGSVATAVLSGRAGYKLGTRNTELKVESILAEITDADVAVHALMNLDEIAVDKKQLGREVAADFVPPVVTGSATVAAIIMGHRMSSAKIAALAAAYGLVDRNFDDYRAKVAEKLTGSKQQAINAELAQDAVDKTPGHKQIVIVEGEVLCFDKPSGRYFNSTVERVRQAANITNAEVVNRGFASVNFFYDELNLPPTTWSGELGFGPDNLLELSIDSTIADGRPCITFDFARSPKSDYADPKYN